MTVAPIHRPRPDRGQALPLLLVVLALATGAALLLVEVVRAAGEEATAQAAADAAALAGAVEGAGAAARLAVANGADLLGYDDRAGTFEATVGLGRATARATAEVVGVPPVGDERLAPAMRAALARVEQLLGRPIAVAPPIDASPLHTVGLAVDVTSEEVDALLAVAADAGLCQPLAQDHPVHFEPCPPTRS